MASLWRRFKLFIIIDVKWTLKQWWAGVRTLVPNGTVQTMTRRQLLRVPTRKWDVENECDTIIIVPRSVFRMHDSNYRAMWFVGTKGDKPVCKMGGGSDVIHLDGIGGYGQHWLATYGGVPDMVPPSGWQMDCLSRSGCLRLWPSGPRRGGIRCGLSLSSFEVYATHKSREEAEQ